MTNSRKNGKFCLLVPNKNPSEEANCYPQTDFICWIESEKSQKSSKSSGRSVVC